MRGWNLPARQSILHWPTPQVNWLYCLSVDVQMTCYNTQNLISSIFLYYFNCGILYLSWQSMALETPGLRVQFPWRTCKLRRIRASAKFLKCRWHYTMMQVSGSSSAGRPSYSLAWSYLLVWVSIDSTYLCGSSGKSNFLSGTKKVYNITTGRVAGPN